MDIQVEDALYKIIKLQDEEVEYRVKQSCLGKPGEIDNSEQIKHAIDSGGFIAEFNSDPATNLKAAFMHLVDSGFSQAKILRRY